MNQNQEHNHWHITVLWTSQLFYVFMSEGVLCPHNSTLPTKTEGVKAHVSVAVHPFGFT